MYGSFIQEGRSDARISCPRVQPGTRFCLDCGNAVNSKDDDLARGLIGIHAKTLNNALRHTSESVWEMCERLAFLAEHGYTEDLKAREQQYGIKYIEGGLLFDRPLRLIHRPIEHYIRDWMHTLVNGGVGNTQCACIIHELEEAGIPSTVAQSFSTECILPKKYGKVAKQWLDQARVKEETLSSFSSVMLSLVPILACFFADCVQPHLEEGHVLLEHIRCFSLLNQILGILTMGADSAMKHLRELQELVLEHHSLFVDLYDKSALKPKFHHTLHLAETFKRIQKVMSCFVCERKHRVAKKAALQVFRHIEHVVLATMVNAQCEQMLDGFSLFQKEFLAHPRTVIFFGIGMLRSSEAVLQCGCIHAQDIVYLEGGVVARVRWFWQVSLGSNIVLQCTMCSSVDGQYKYRDSKKLHFTPVDAIVDAMIYRYIGSGVFRIIKPFAAKYR